MNHRSHNPPSFAAAIGGSLLALALMAAPAGLTSRLRVATHDLLRPGQRLIERMPGRFIPLSFVASGAAPADADTAEELEQLRKELGSARAAFRASEARRLQLARKLAERNVQGDIPSGEPLFLSRLLAAQVLKSPKRSLDATFVIDAGTQKHLDRNSLVLDDDATVIDQGTDAQVQNGQPVIAGRCVVGRIQQAGLWTSLVQPISAIGFSAPVNLVRHANGEPISGPDGILKGNGDGTCLIHGVQYTEPVAVGDDIYGLPHPDRAPLYYGRIIAATMQPGATWNIRMRPASDIASLHRVLVLRDAVNPQREVPE